MSSCLIIDGFSPKKKNKYNISNFISTSSKQINEFLPNWREPSSKKGMQPLIDEFIDKNISTFDLLKFEINNLWSEEISIMNKSRLNSKGEINLDKNRFINPFRENVK